MDEIKIVKKILAIVAFSISVPAIAQTSFLGISLELPFPGDIKECPKLKTMNMVDHEILKEAGTCYFMEHPQIYVIHNGPDLGISHLLKIETSADKPLIFSFSFEKTKYGQAVDIFTTRYGKPKNTYRETVRTGVGELFDSKTNIWEGKILRIQLDEIGKDVRWSDAVILNVSLMKSMNKKNKEAAEAAARKL